MRYFWIGVLLSAVSLYAIGGIQETCNAEGGCFLITKQAYERLLEEVHRLAKELSSRRTCI